MEFFIGIIILVVILVVRGNYKERKRQEEFQKKQFIEEQKRIREDEIKKREELRFENLLVVFADNDNNGKPKAILKRSNNVYASVERVVNNFEPFSVGKTLRFEKEITNKWNWYDEVEYQRQLATNKQKKIDELNDETIVIIYENLDDNGKPVAIAKRKDGTYASIERVANNYDPYTVGESIRIKKEIIDRWNWYDETEYKKQLILKEQQKRQKEINELNNETIIVVYENVNDNNKPIAIVKRINNTYASVERPNKRFEVYEEIRITKETINKWHWYDETEYQRQLILKQKIDIDRKRTIEEQNLYFKQFGIDYLFHMTHKDNLQNILQNGLKSHNYARKNNLTRVDIADNQVNDRRSRFEPIYDRSIHDYVPLYFNPKNPMLFRRSNIQNDIIILAIDRNLLLQENVVFTNGNAASKATSFYKKIEDLDKLNWNCINAEYWNDIEDGKRIRCSETLVYPNIPVTAIQKIYCNNELTKQYIISLLNNFPNIKTEINSNLYFGNIINQYNYNHLQIPFNNDISMDDLDDLPF
ncbi:conserved hypothetical protein [uncultured Dysgonomonas sp.]|uniref:DarT domain-containing protein n=1 Tax=uncultured Dysgonomonas sp. TaxID=206096 RepID=A0A212J8X1_9BACT|nr:DUF4433 domain-containing protein [uncultured Dysgonomonas sp.]SBV95876.1 conserved hypothetical protein [uncultured Dysgonomonas sp.]